MTLPRFARTLFFPALLLITLTASAEVRLPKLWKLLLKTRELAMKPLK